MKIAYVGGGSHFFELVNIEIAQTPELHGASIAVYDILPESAGAMERFSPDIVHVVNLPNNGTIPNVPPWAVAEMKCVARQHGAQPVHVGDLPPQAARWTLAQFYGYELLIEAAAEGSRTKALQALASDPMVRDFHELRIILDALVAAPGDRLAAFRTS